MTVLPSCRPSFSAHSTASGGDSSWQTITRARSNAARCASIMAGVSSSLAPATMTMVFCPLLATVTHAMPVAASACADTMDVSTPSRRKPSHRAAP